MCGKLVLPRNMARHIKGVHERRGRQKAVKGRGGDVLSQREGPGDEKEEEQDVDGGIPTVEEEENAGASAREEEEIPETPDEKEKRQSESQCKLCNYTGTDDEMTGHIVSTHVTPPKKQ